MSTLRFHFSGTQVVKIGQGQQSGPIFERYAVDHKMKNRFVQIAMHQALHLVSRRARLISLAAQCAQWLASGKAGKQLKNMRHDAATLTRMVSAYASGTYRALPKHVLLSVTAALVYFLNPFD